MPERILRAAGMQKAARLPVTASGCARAPFEAKPLVVLGRRAAFTAVDPDWLSGFADGPREPIRACACAAPDPVNTFNVVPQCEAPLK